MFPRNKMKLREVSLLSKVIYAVRSSTDTGMLISAQPYDSFLDFNMLCPSVLRYFQENLE